MKSIILYQNEILSILDGSQTQIRRVIKPLKDKVDGELLSCPIMGIISGYNGTEYWDLYAGELGGLVKCPYGIIGDKLWAKETFMYDPPINGEWEHYGDDFEPKKIPSRYRKPKYIIYKASHNEMHGWKWKLSVHMPCWASRTTLEITNIEVKQVQDMSSEEVFANGIEMYSNRYWNLSTDKDVYGMYWDKNNKIKFENNPWVWVINFKTKKIK